MQRIFYRLLRSPRSSDYLRRVHCPPGYIRRMQPAYMEE